MSSPADEVMGPDDRAMLDRLRSVAAKAETAPPEVLQAARAAFLWRRIDEELAELTVDSAEDLLAAAGVRDAEEGRLLVFEVKGRVAIEVEVASAPDGLRILGQLVPAQPGKARVLHGSHGGNGHRRTRLLRRPEGDLRACPSRTPSWRRSLDRGGPGPALRPRRPQRGRHPGRSHGGKGSTFWFTLPCSPAIVAGTR